MKKLLLVATVVAVSWVPTASADVRLNDVRANDVRHGVAPNPWKVTDVRQAKLRPNPWKEIRANRADWTS